VATGREYWGSRETVEAGNLLLMALCRCRRHAFRGSNEIFGVLHVEEVEIEDVVIFRGPENVYWNAIGNTTFFIHGMEEVEE
jgi:hypothetical protein